MQSAVTNLMTINLDLERSTQLHCVQLFLNALSSTTLREAVTSFVPLLFSIRRLIMLIIGYFSINFVMWFSRRIRSNTTFYANDLMATNFRNTHPVSMTVIFYQECCIKNINRFDDICWRFPLYFIFIIWLRFVNHLLNYRYYLFTYLLMLITLQKVILLCVY